MPISGNFNFRQQAVSQTPQNGAVAHGLDDGNGTKKTGEKPVDKAVWNAGNCGKAKPGDVIIDNDGFWRLDPDGGMTRVDEEEMLEAREMIKGDVRSDLRLPQKVENN